MSDETGDDYYELLQISPGAEPETIHRVYRLLATRFHPDNQQTGSVEKFHALLAAYAVLSDPEQRARYDVKREEQRDHRWRLKSADAVNLDDDVEAEQLVRLTVLDVLYTKRRAEPHNPGVFILDLEQLTGRAREHLEFTIWYLIQKQLIARGEQSRLVITATGVDHLEDHHETHIQRRRLKAADIPEPSPS